MKKVYLIIFVISLFGLSACSSRNVESPADSSSTEKSIDVAESTDKAEQEKTILSLTSESNKKIANAFSKEDLSMYNAQTDGPSEMAPVPEDNPMNRPIYSSGMSFYVSNKKEGFIIYIENYNSNEELTTAENYVKDNAVDNLLVSKNDSLFSLMFSYPGITDQSTKEQDTDNFNKYKEVFEQIK